MDNDIAKALFGNNSSTGAGVVMMYGVALEDSAEGEVLVQLDDEILALGYEEEEGVVLELEEDDDSIDAIEDDVLEEEPGEDDEDYAEDVDETNEDDEDATEEADYDEEV